MGNASTTERARGIAPQTAAPQTAIPGRSTRIDPSESAAGAAAAGGPLVARIAALRARLASAPLVEMDAAAAKRFEALHAQLRQALRPAALRSVDEAPPAFAASMMPVPSMPPPTGLPPTAMPPTLPPAAAPAVEGEVIFDLAAEEAAAGTVVAEAGALSGLLGLLAAVVAIAVVALLVIAIVELLEQHAHPVPAPHEEPRVDDGPRFGPKGKGKGKGKDKGPDVSPDAPGGPRDKDKKKPTHRGRLQVQGMDMARHPNGELSFPWAQTTPMTKAIAQAQLELLKAACTEEQRKARLEAFEKASDCIASHVARGSAHIFAVVPKHGEPREPRPTPQVLASRYRDPSGWRVRMMTYDELDAIRDDEHVDAYEPILYTVEEIAETDAGLATLVARYADARNYWLVAPITFFVSTASKPETGRDTTALVWDLVARLQTDNQSARVNVMTAIVMRTIAVEGLVAPPSLYPFLLRSLDLDPLVQSGVAQVFGDLYWQGSLEHWPREHIDTLRARLRALRDPAGDRLLQSELRDLDFLDD